MHRKLVIALYKGSSPGAEGFSRVSLFHEKVTFSLILAENTNSLQSIICSLENFSTKYGFFEKQVYS